MSSCLLVKIDILIFSSDKLYFELMDETTSSSTGTTYLDKSNPSLTINFPLSLYVENHG